MQKKDRDTVSIPLLQVSQYNPQICSRLTQLSELHFDFMDYWKQKSKMSHMKSGHSMKLMEQHSHSL